MNDIYGRRGERRTDEGKVDAMYKLKALRNAGIVETERILSGNKLQNRTAMRKRIGILLCDEWEYEFIWVSLSTSHKSDKNAENKSSTTSTYKYLDEAFLSIKEKGLY